MVRLSDVCRAQGSGTELRNKCVKSRLLHSCSMESCSSSPCSSTASCGSSSTFWMSGMTLSQRAKLTLTRWPEASSFRAGPVILKSSRSGGPVSILNAYRSVFCAIIKKKSNVALALCKYSKRHRNMCCCAKYIKCSVIG